MLVTLGEDLSNEPVLKVWALDKLDKKTSMPTCISSVVIQTGRRQFPITAFAALDNLSQIALGFGNGAVKVIRGDLIHDRGTKQRTVFESEEPITGVEFSEGNQTTLYIATTGRIATLVISGRGQGQPPRPVEETGCAVNCMTLDSVSSDIIVARDDAIYYYGARGGRSVFPYDIQKKLLTTFKDYIAVVSPPQSNAVSGSDRARTFGNGQIDDVFSTSSFTVLSTDPQFIAYQETLTSPVQSVFEEWGDLFILTTDGKLFRYREKSMAQKLEILYQRNLFVMAIDIAKKAGLDKAHQNTIYRKYGDYLYQKQDYDTAMQMYLKAIDNTEPSQVIRKYLDSQRIHNLIDYLEELHDHHKATSDHTTLLLNCYAKLKDVQKLEAFIKSPGDLKFDLDTAILMCRQGGYFDQAAYLARKHNEHELVVDILIEDSKKYAEALAYIWRLEPTDAFANMSKYATVLLEHCPKDTTQLFIDYYTGNYRPKQDAIVVTSPSPATQGQKSIATTAVQNLAAMLPLPYMSTSAVQTPGADGETQTTLGEARIIETTTNEPAPTYTTPKPRTAFSAFVDHPELFIEFLEACIASPDIEEADKTDLHTTLFEMYLHTATGKKGEAKERWENKAKDLIAGQKVGNSQTLEGLLLTIKKIPIDASNVLLLSSLENFRTGTTLVREQQGLRFDIFRSYTSAKDTAGAIKALRKYGPEESQLYPAALAYFTSTPAVLEEAGDELDAVLKKIDDDGLMAPMQVIQTLSTNGVATMGLIKTYLGRNIERERQEIANNRRLIDTFKTDTETKRAEIATLATKPSVFQATRCSACGQSLDLPTVHFLCKHSFHQRCLNAGDGEDVSRETGPGAVECPVCAPQNATIRAIRKAQDESASRHELFQDALGRSRDKFGTISEWFGRGVMSVPGIE